MTFEKKSKIKPKEESINVSTLNCKVPPKIFSKRTKQDFYDEYADGSLNLTQFLEKLDNKHQKKVNSKKPKD